MEEQTEVDVPVFAEEEEEKMSRTDLEIWMGGYISFQATQYLASYVT